MCQKRLEMKSLQMINGVTVGVALQIGRQKKQRSKKKVEVPTIQGSRSSSRTDKKERKESKQGAVSEPQSRNKSKRNPPKRRWRPIPQ
mmetsp:Transcript_13559/g.20387  ORF Transcript_13559/g.20387 Transcript_13559/m.20387 type:complete len:88 (+) Transcript_13559:2055-2318(+)